MRQKTIKFFLSKIDSEGPKQNYITNKTDVYHIDDIWSLDILGSNDYGPEKNRGYRHVLVVIGYFSKFGCSLP